MTDKPICLGCGKEATFKALIDGKSEEYFCDSCVGEVWFKDKYSLRIIKKEK